MIAIVGPTASGKTEAGLTLASQINGEIISVDSRQVYRGLPVGTAQPRQTSVPYHLIGFLDPRLPFSAVDFVTKAESLLTDIQRRGKTPIFVGGTGFYFRALLEGLAPLPTADETLRRRLRLDAERLGRSALHERLRQVDPRSADLIPANNIQRLIRALEVFELSGKPLSQWHAEHQKQRTSPRHPIRIIGIDPGKDVLEERIRVRSTSMLREGMVEETQALLDQGVPEHAAGFTGVGYPHVIAFIKGKLTQAELLARLIQDTRQYAKRQRTWFRHQMEVEWKKS